MKKIKDAINKLKILNKIQLFKILTLIITVDIISFYSLSSLNIFELLNPLKFLDPPAVDTRNYLILYYPSIDIENNSVDDDESNLNLKKNNKHHKKIKKEYVFKKDEIISIKQKVFQQFDAENNNLQLTDNVRFIIQELIIGPNDKENKAKRFIKEKMLIKEIWAYKNNIILNIDKKIWDDIELKRQYIIKYCVEKSIMTNIFSLENVIWSFSNTSGPA
ncbi:MAG: hypothetical protein OEZ22_03950 [Spirochaetia bacterium]|nr:hypothetical protein [Spirochaetia bacterium]